MVRQRADALMLSGESAIGAYPEKALGVLRQVSTRIEEWCRCVHLSAPHKRHLVADAHVGCSRSEVAGWDLLHSFVCSSEVRGTRLMAICCPLSLSDVETDIPDDSKL